MSRIAGIGVVLSCVLLAACTDQGTKDDTAPTPPATSQPAAEAGESAEAGEAAASGGEAIATFAGGCFWCMEPPYEGRPGIRSVVSGYSGGPEANPTYKQVSRGRTGHTEAVQIVYDPSKISYEQLVDIFWKSMDPTDRGGQFADRGTQYRPVIFAHDAEQRRLAEASKAALESAKTFGKPIVVPITDYSQFWPAEEYHQDYYKKNSSHYKRYRVGSGREGFLKTVWGDDASGAKSRR